MAWSFRKDGIACAFFETLALDRRSATRCQARPFTFAGYQADAASLQALERHVGSTPLAGSELQRFNWRWAS